MSDDNRDNAEHRDESVPADEAAAARERARERAADDHLPRKSGTSAKS